MDLPARPLLLTFDDARADSWTGADGILRKLDYTAVMFVDVGRVDGGDPEYLPVAGAADDAGQRALGAAAPRRTRSPVHPVRARSERHRALLRVPEAGRGLRRLASSASQSDIEWGQQTLADHIPAYRPLAFSPPYGSYGQDGTNDPRIPDTLLAWLTGRFGLVFTQDVNALVHAGSGQPLGRIQVTRAMTGGELHDNLQTGEN